MIPRKPLAPNNRSVKTLMGEFSGLGAFPIKYPKSNEQTSIRLWARRSQRQNGEGFGGGNRVMK
jgi:hypothetical protein